MRFQKQKCNPETCKAQGGRTLTNSPSHPREAEAERATPARVRGGNSCEAHTDMFFTRGLLLLASLAVVKVSACVPRLAAAQLLDFSACIMGWRVWRARERPGTGMCAEGARIRQLYAGHPRTDWSLLTRCDARVMAQAFSAPGALGLREGAVRRSSCRGGALSLRAEREDGASPDQVKKAYETYNMLMENKNFGKGYWMDEKPFFANIVEAIQLNFGGDKATVQDMATDDGDAPGQSVNLNKSLFKPLVPVGDTEDEPEEMSEPVKMAKEEPAKMKMPVDEDDADLKELQEKMAKAKKAAKEE